MKNNYNNSILHKETFDLSANELWKIISKPSNLELYHPFCKSNTPIEWNDKNHADKFGRLVVQDDGGRLKPFSTTTSEVLRKVSRLAK